MNDQRRPSISLRTWLVMWSFCTIGTGLFALASGLLVYVSTGATVTFQVLAGVAALFGAVCFVGTLVRLILGPPRESRSGLTIKAQKFE
jgi:hypothetical protein